MKGRRVINAKRDAEIVRLAVSGKRRKDIAAGLGISISACAQVLFKARGKGLLARVPRGRPAGHVGEYLDEAQPVQRLPDPPDYEHRLGDLVARGLPLTHIAAKFRKPYREIIADIERLGISNVRAR